MKYFTCSAFKHFIWLFIFPAFALATSINHSIVRIDVTGKRYDYTSPWQAPSQIKGNGSGFVIEAEGDKWILTNAHVVANHIFIEIKVAGFPEPFIAKVHNIGYDCDLALLKVEDPKFQELAQPLLVVDKVPTVSDPLISYGFPMGGEQVCAVKGTVSRVEVGLYLPKSTRLLHFQTDMAINPGNSGGPVLHDGQVIGVAFQTVRNASNIGYVIPSSIVQHFLKDTFSKTYGGFLRAGASVQLLKNPAMRRFYKMRPEHSGVLVTEVLEGSGLENVLIPGDIILSIDGHKIENDGTFNYQGKYYIDFSFLISDKFVDDRISLEVLREGEVVSLEATLVSSTLFGEKIRSKEYDKQPSYFIFGGCVFQPLVWNYFERPKGHYRPIHLIERDIDNYKSEPEDEIIILSRVLADPTTLGYQSMADMKVKSVNNKSISSMNDLIEAFSDKQCDYFVIQLEGEHKLIFDRQESKAANQVILERYQIPSDRSFDLLENPNQL